MATIANQKTGKAVEAQVLDISSRAAQPVATHKAALVALNATGSAVAKINNNVIFVENFINSTMIELPPQNSQVDAAAFSPDRTRIVTAGSDRRARIWEIGTGQRLRTLIGHHGSITAAAFSPDGNLIATAGNEDIAKLWDAKTGRLLRDLTGHRARILGLAFSPDSTRVATAGYDSTVHIWDSSSGRDLTADARSAVPRLSSASRSVAMVSSSLSLARSRQRSSMRCRSRPSRACRRRPICRPD